MQAALELFSRKDYGSTSIGEITTMVDTTKGALYYHFTDKEELFVEVCQAAMEAYQREVFSKSLSRKVTGPRIRELIRNSYIFDVESQKYSKLYRRILAEDWSSNQKLYPIFKQFYQSFYEQVGQIVQADIDCGYIQDVDISALTTLIIAILDGLSIRNTVEMNESLEKSDIDTISDIIINRLK